MQVHWEIVFYKIQFLTFCCYLLLSICRDHLYLKLYKLLTDSGQLIGTQPHFTTPRSLLSISSPNSISRCNSWKSLLIVLKHITHGVKDMKKQLFFHIKLHQANYSIRDTRNTVYLSCSVTCLSSICHPGASFFSGKSPVIQARQQINLSLDFLAIIIEWLDLEGTLKII